MHPEHDGYDGDKTDLVAQMRATARELNARADKIEAEQEDQPVSAKERARRLHGWSVIGGIAAIITGSWLARFLRAYAVPATAVAAAAGGAAVTFALMPTIGGRPSRPPAPPITAPTPQPTAPPVPTLTPSPTSPTPTIPPPSPIEATPEPISMGHTPGDESPVDTVTPVIEEPPVDEQPAMDVKEPPDCMNVQILRVLSIQLMCRT